MYSASVAIAGNITCSCTRTNYGFCHYLAVMSALGLGWAMSQLFRWCSAGVVTVTVFGAVTGICVLSLRPMVHSGADRWVIASALGVAVAALAATWGASWAARDGPQDAGPGSSGGSGRSVQAASGGIAIGGDNLGIASTSRNTQEAEDQ
jgi:hypothetical protein